MRQSIIGDFDICQRRAQYSFQHPIHSSGQTRAIGTGYHAGLEAYYLERQVGGPVEPEHVDYYVQEAIKAFDEDAETADDFHWDLLETEGTTREDSHQIIEAMVRSYFDNAYYWPADYTVLGVEHRIEADWIDGWAGAGTIDLVLYHEATDWVVAVDAKTARRMWPAKKASARVNNQAPWYVKWLRELYGTEQVTFVFDVMRRDGKKFNRFRSDVDARHVLAITRKAETVAALLDSGLDLPPNQQSNLCSAVYCDYWSVCPFGAALDDL